MSGQSNSSLLPVMVETRPGAAWYTGGTGQTTALSHPLPARVLDRPLEELPGDFEILDGIDEMDRRAT